MAQRHPRLKLLAALLVGVALIYAGLALFTARLAVFPGWYRPKLEASARLPACTLYQQDVYRYCDDPSKSLGLEFQEFAIETTADGRAVRTSGWWIWPDKAGGPSKGAVILVHGGGADRRAMLKHARYLQAAGYHALLIDCHNHGLNPRDGRGIGLGLRESQSVLAAVGWAERQLVSVEGVKPPILVMGTSQGAFAALAAASRSRSIRAVVAENPYVSVERVLLEFPGYTWIPGLIKRGAFVLVGLWLGQEPGELDARTFVPRLGNTPVFLIHSKEDLVVNHEHSSELAALLSGPHELWLTSGGAHEAIWNELGRRYEERVLRFLEAAVRSGSAAAP